MKKIAVIFGGAGFIGSHFAEYLVRSCFYKVVLVDIKNISDRDASEFFITELQGGRIEYVYSDVRDSIDIDFIEGGVSLIANFAAVHREPGHEQHEYFETNLLGAENVCAWAEKVGCNNLIFTSSIAPYGPTEDAKNEQSIPVPVSAYGGSKLAAEKIHIAWQHKDIENRHLVIVRPGVVFGPGEGGNVSRLVKAVLHRYFFYMGNRDTRKAGTYVKELCHAMMWVLNKQNETGERVSLFNMAMNPGPSIQDYVDTCCKVAGVKRKVFSVPYSLLLFVSYIIDFVAKPLGVKHPFSPVRIRKLVRSNNITPQYLIDHGYQYQYTLEEAFSDWKESNPNEWK